jgi:hypothetical protein
MIDQKKKENPKDIKIIVVKKEEKPKYENKNIVYCNHNGVIIPTFISKL